LALFRNLFFMLESFSHGGACVELEGGGVVE